MPRSVGSGIRYPGRGRCRGCRHNSCGSRPCISFHSQPLLKQTDKAIHIAQKLCHKTHWTKNKRCQIPQCLILLPGPKTTFSHNTGCRTKGTEKAAKWCRLPERRTRTQCCYFFWGATESRHHLPQCHETPFRFQHDRLHLPSFSPSFGLSLIAARVAHPAHCLENVWRL